METDKKSLFFLITAIVAFIADILTIISLLPIPGISIATNTHDLPEINISIGGLDSIHWTFALIVYIAVVLTWYQKNIYEKVQNKINYYQQNPYHLDVRIQKINEVRQLEKRTTFLIAIPPSVLLISWSIAFLNHTWWAILICLFVAGVWCVVFLDGDYFIFALSIMFPTFALLLMFFQIVSPPIAWGASLLICILVPLVLSIK